MADSTIGNLAVTATTPAVTDFLAIDDGTGADKVTIATLIGVAGAEIKTAYEAEADTNAYDDAAVTKLAGIETAADVTDAANVTAAGALMDSEVDADIKTLVLPANTTISTFGASLVDDAAASNARTTLGLVIGTDVDLAGAAGAVCPPIIIAVGDETTAITTGTAKVTFRMPFAMTLNAGNAGVRASLTTSSSSGIPTVDINDGGTTILSTKLTVDASETTSLTAATAVVISDTALADDAEITIDIDVAGTGAAGLKVTLMGKYA